MAGKLPEQHQSTDAPLKLAPLEEDLDPKEKGLVDEDDAYQLHRRRELAPSSGGGSSASLGDEAMERDDTIVNGNGADSFPIPSSFTGVRGRDAARGTCVNPGGYVIVDIDTLWNLFSANHNNATSDVAVAGADSDHPDMLEKMEKILIPLLSFSLPLCVTAYPIVKDLPEAERHLAYGLMGSVPAVLFLGLLPLLFSKSPKAGTLAISALLLASGIVIGLFTWAWCSLNPSVEYVIPMGVAGALLLCATIILMMAFFLCRKRVTAANK